MYQTNLSVTYSPSIRTVKRIFWFLVMLLLSIGAALLPKHVVVAQADGVTPRLVKDIHTGTQGASFSEFIEVGDEKYIFSEPGGLWRLDALSDELISSNDSLCPIESVHAAEFYSSIVWQDHLYHFCGTSLWRSDGTANGITLVHEFPEMELAASKERACGLPNCKQYFVY